MFSTASQAPAIEKFNQQQNRSLMYTRKLTDVGPMRLVSVPSLELLPVHLVALQVLVLVFAVARVRIDVDDDVRAVLPGIATDADA